jgi:hypothetical protein
LFGKLLFEKIVGVRALKKLSEEKLNEEKLRATASL